MPPGPGDAGSAARERPLLSDPVSADSRAAGDAPRPHAGAQRPRRWCCVQLGAREGYAVPRALHRRKNLDLLVTDLWSDHVPVARSLSRSVGDRAHAELADAPVASAGAAGLARELGVRLRRPPGWTRVMARNRWFQDMAVGHLARLRLEDGEATVFAYSYAAGDIFAYARRRGWRTVLGQIDPGPVEEGLVAEEHRRRPDLAPDWRPAPEEYWRDWRREVALADRIVVNSAWSREGLETAGVPPDRLDVIPLAYEPPAEAAGFRRRYPRRFDDRRPLRALFLGQVTLRKGVGALLDAAELMAHAPVEFRFVGPLQIVPPAAAVANRRVVFAGQVPRSDVHRHYRDADILVFPTLSDGFGLTQLEARAWRLPLIVTGRCGAVVEDGVSGAVVEAGDADAIAAAIGRCLADPGWLQSAADAIAPGERHGIDQLGRALMATA